MRATTQPKKLLAQKKPVQEKLVMQEKSGKARSKSASAARPQHKVAVAERRVKNRNAIYPAGARPAAKNTDREKEKRDRTKT